jgi:hypothetical protein
MRVRARRELSVGFQYLVIGIIAEIAANRWFRREGNDIVRQVVAWCVIAITLGILRIAIIVISSVVRRDQWQSISRRNWI